MLSGDEDLSIDGNNYWMATLEVETKNMTVIGPPLTVRSIDTLFCNVGAEGFSIYVSYNYMALIILQASMLNNMFCIYIVSSEARVLHNIFISIQKICRDVCIKAFRSIEKFKLMRVNGAASTIHQFANNNQAKITIKRIEKLEKSTQSCFQ